MPRIQACNNEIELTLVGNNVRCLRQMRSMKAEEMARQLGLSKASYSDIENNKVRIRLERLQQIADILGVHYSQVINFNPQHLMSPVDTASPMPTNSDMTHSLIHQLAVKDKQIHFLQEQIHFYKGLLAERRQLVAEGY
jgi:transcriptional regulator with XRE-family HTH domain